MRIACWQTILMKYHSLFLSKIRKDVAKMSSAAVMIGALRVSCDIRTLGSSFRGHKHNGVPLV